MEQGYELDHWLSGGGGEWHSGCPAAFGGLKSPFQTAEATVANEARKGAGVEKGCSLVFLLKFSSTLKVKKKRIALIYLS